MALVLSTTPRVRPGGNATTIQEGFALPTFDTPEPISATVDIVFGDIRFIATDRTDTVVEVRPVDPSWELDVKAAEQVKIDFTRGKLQLRHPKMRNLWTSEYGSIEVLVELPSGSAVHGDTAKGRYLVEGAVGACELKTAIGDIRVERASGARLKTTGGKVIVDHVTGQADVDANGEIRLRRIDGGAVVKNISGGSWVGEVGGDLRMKSATGPITVDLAHARVDAHTSNGDIRIGELGGGTADLSTAVGEVQLGLPHGTAAELDTRTSAGRVRNDLDTDAAACSGRTVKVRARSHGGDIVLRRA